MLDGSFEVMSIKLPHLLFNDNHFRYLNFHIVQKDPNLICDRDCARGVLEGMEGLQHPGGVLVEGESLLILVH